MAVVVDALASRFAEALADLIKEEVSMLLGVKDELQLLDKKLGLIRAVLEDAEHKAFTGSPICLWLSELKDIVYDADDVLDQCRIHGQKLARMQSERSSSTPLVHCYSPFLLFFHKVSFRHKIVGSIRNINVRLEKVIKAKSDFGLVTSIRDDHNSIRLQRQTDPGVEPDVVGKGIENDTNKLVGMLVAKRGPPLSIIAIVGMGGLGKTTLAQNIYNDRTIRDHFQVPLPMWVCVSREYSETSLMKEIIRCAGGNPGNAQTLGELKLILNLLIEQKKFLLILDDVWNAQVWENLLRKPLQSSASGSRVLITTRSEHVAKEIGAMHLHKVEPLTMDESWSLLCKLVFRAGEEGLETVWNIGIQIVLKCGGLPLALKTIAGVLRSKEKTKWAWEKILQHPAWSLTDLPDGVMGVLYLSYEDLPFHLKQCFIYCGLFPDDYVFLRHTLIQHWVAEGFVKEEGDMIMEDVARDYYKDLLGRSLLQADPRFYDDGGCKMHDLLRSLAQFLARDESFSGDVKGLVNAFTSSSSSTSIKLRHLSIVDMEMMSIPEVVIKQEHLRTLLFTLVPLVRDLPEVLFEKLRRLWVLEFSFVELKKVPESLGNLIHLRYLDLSGSSIEALPETIGSLSNLQYLILQNCIRLQNLPKATTKLYNMRSLDLLHTPVSGLPAGVRKLQHLNRLIGFVTNENTGNCLLEEISSLYRLRKLTLENLESALVRTKDRGSLLKDKRHLRDLELCCLPIRADGQPFGLEEAEKIQKVYEEELSPPPLLERFKINGYFGLQYPKWMTMRTFVSLFFNLRRLQLVNCVYCTQLPTLGLLPNLDLLKIRGASSVKIIGPEFMGTLVSSVLFPELKTLNLKDMPNWVQWIWNEVNGVAIMPRLESLKIGNCPNLSSLPEGLIHHATSLHRLQIQGVDMLTTVENFHSVKVLVVSNNANLRKVSNLPSLQELLVIECPVLEEMGGLNSLQSLGLQDLTMESLPEWLKLIPAIQRVRIILSDIGVLQNFHGGPEWPKIQNFPYVYIQSYFGPEFVFYTKDPFTFNTNLLVGGGDSDNETANTNTQLADVGNESINANLQL